MVVLSACETGLGKLSNGDKLIGLTRAFIYAGTPSVITTLWNVNDRASFALMREFYSNLKTMNKSEALRQSQIKTMKESPRARLLGGLWADRRAVTSGPLPLIKTASLLRKACRNQPEDIQWAAVPARFGHTDLLKRARIPKMHLHLKDYLNPVRRDGAIEK